MFWCFDISRHGPLRGSTEFRVFSEYINHFQKYNSHDLIDAYNVSIKKKRLVERVAKKVSKKQQHLNLKNRH